jgi:hypothetical protein
MKRLILFLCILLSNCSLYNAYFMAEFDNNEYKLINSIRTQANLGTSKCGSSEFVSTVDSIYYTTVEFRNYSQYIPHNEETIRLSSELSEMAKGFYDRAHSKEPVSMLYCTTKFGSLEKNAILVQNVVGKKPK